MHSPGHRAIAPAHHSRCLLSPARARALYFALLLRPRPLPPACARVWACAFRSCPGRSAACAMPRRLPLSLCLPRCLPRCLSLCVSRSSLASPRFSRPPRFSLPARLYLFYFCSRARTQEEACSAGLLCIYHYILYVSLIIAFAYSITSTTTTYTAYIPTP